MAKDSSYYVCQKCAGEFPKWAGQCGNCGEWNSLIETVVSSRRGRKSGISKKAKVGGVKPVSLSEVKGVVGGRIKTGIQ